MADFLLALSFWQLLVFILIPLSVLLSLPPLFIRRRYPYDRLKVNNQVAGYKYSMLGVVYAVLLAFLVFDAHREYNTVQERVEAEAAHVNDIFRDVRGFSEPARSALTRHILSYAKEVRDNEWTMMATGKVDKVAWQLFDSLWKEVMKYEPTSVKEQAFFATALDNMTRLGDFRRLRMISMRSQIPDVMWFVVIVFGVLTLGFGYFFASENVRMQAAMNAIVNFCVILVLALVLHMDHPFTGSMSIDNGAYKLGIERIETALTVQ
jgi:hypothetical protein